MSPKEFQSFASIDELIRSGYPTNSIGRIKLEGKDTHRIASAINKAVISWKDISKVPTKVFIKCCVSGSRVASNQSVLPTFNKEASFYTDLLPKMTKFEAEKGITKDESIETLIPKFVATGWVGDDFFICLEDLIATGFIVTGEKEFHSVEQIKMALTNLAHLHATSNAMSINPKEFEYLEDHLNKLDEKSGKIFNEFFTQPLIDNLCTVKLVLEAKAKNLPELDHICVPKIVNMDLIEELITLCHHLHKVFNRTRCVDMGNLGVLCHGDFHMWNMAFKGDQFKIFDFQEVNWSAPTVDIHHYLCQVTTAKIRDENLPAFLDTYLQSFRDFYQKLGMEPPAMFTAEMLKCDYVSRSPTSFVYGFPWLMRRFVTDEACMKAAQNKHYGSTEERIKQLKMAGPNIWDIVQIYIDNIEHYEKLGTFKVMEDLVGQ